MRAEKGAENAEESEEESNDEDDDEMPSIDTDDFNGYKKKMEKQVKYTPESRYQMYKEEEVRNRITRLTLQKGNVSCV
jgi:hypothetical protein